MTTHRILGIRVRRPRKVFLYVSSGITVGAAGLFFLGFKFGWLTGAEAVLGWTGASGAAIARGCGVRLERGPKHLMLSLMFSVVLGIGFYLGALLCGALHGWIFG